jgi:hypothetical protein
MLTKNLPKNKMYSVLLSRMVLDGIAGIQFLITGKFSHFTAILKAHFSFYNLFLDHYKKRTKFQEQKYYNTKSIVYIYFIKKIVVFNDLFRKK